MTIVTACAKFNQANYFQDSIVIPKDQHAPHRSKSLFHFVNTLMMSVEIITKEDLFHFKQELLSELKLILTPPAPVKPWLRSYEVRKLLNISSGTLQTLRINGTLRYSKMGGTMFYKMEDIQKALELGSAKNNG